MNTLKTITDLSSYYGQYPIKEIETAEDCRSSPDYSGGDVRHIAKYFGLTYLTTCTIDFCNSSELLTIEEFMVHLTNLRIHYIERTFYTAVTEIHENQLSISIFYKQKE